MGNFKKLFLNRTTALILGLSVYSSGCVFGENKQFFDTTTTPVTVVPPGSVGTTPTPKPIYAAKIVVGATESNPPLDLFFVVDNSASMLGHQINLGSAFSNIFTANSAALSNFDTNVYVFSTASTVNTSYQGQIPTRAPASVATIPALSDLTNLAATPGSIFGIWNQASGQYGVAPFTSQINPAALLNTANGVVYSSLFLGKKGTQTDAEYQSNITALTQQFQNKLSYLNPTNQLSEEPLTDISSGLCSMSRILKHSNGFISPGDSAAFVLVSDDNDRLNDRNPNNNQCVDSVVGSNEVVDGTCGHYQTNFSYNSSASVTYQTDSKFTYQSGTQLSYTYPSSESCGISYTKGYHYTWTYTAVQTAVTYTKCTLTGDGTCLTQAPGTVVKIAGNYAGTNGACTQDVSGLVSNPAPGTAYSCVSNNLANQVGTAGVDTASTGSACSAATLATLTSQANKTAVHCTVTTPNTLTATVASQGIGSCTNYCSANQATYPGCALTKTTSNTTSGSLSFTQDGVTCNSTCPDSTKCGTGTVAAYFTSLHNTATCNAPTALLSTIVVSAGATSDAKALTCSTPLTGLTVKNASSQVICGGQASVQSCITSLQTGNPTTPCAATTSDTAVVTAPVSVGCATTCAASAGFCPSTYTNVASYLAQTKGAFCKSSANGGAKKFSLVFNTATGNTGSCSTLCSNTASGSCDGLGYGAGNGATIANYVTSLNGATCTSANVSVADTTSFAVASTGTGTACTAPASPFFFASDAAHPASSVTNYVAGDSTHKAIDFQNYIVSQSKAVLGANNLPAVAVIGHLTTDNLYGTDASTDYINLAKAMGSNQVTSISGNYSTALAQISDFIVEKTQNSFALPIPSSNSVFAVSVLHPGTTTWVALNTNLWTWAGTTLSVSPTVNLEVGDQLMYQYTQ